MNRVTDYSKLATDITAWIREYATTNNIKSLVVGVSGGIDSAVVSTLCAMTGLPTYCCFLDIHTIDAHSWLSMGHIGNLATKHPSVICLEQLNLTSAFDELIKCIERTDLHAYVNTKSRLRMTALYHIATCTHGIVVGTGNKVEDFGVGFYTKYGDGGVDISPIADLYKTEVRELGRYLGISQEILDAAPTDGLWSDGRTDEQQLGATYEELEWAMEVVHTPTFKGYTMDVKREQEVLEIYHRLHKQNQHKMLPIPIYKLSA